MDAARGVATVVMNMSRGRKVEPRIVVFCRCGAAWFGRAAIENPVMESHRARCGAPISAGTYEARGWRIKWPQWWTAHERDTARACAADPQ